MWRQRETTMNVKKLMMAGLLFTGMTMSALSAAAQPEVRMASKVLPGWDLVYYSQIGPQPTWEYVAVGENRKAWTKKITLSAFRGEARLTPRNYMNSVIQLAALNCEGYGASNYEEFIEAGFPAAGWVSVCGKNKGSGQGEIMWFKVIRGPQDFNVARFAWRVGPYDVNAPPWNVEMLKESVMFMKTFTVCVMNEKGDNCGKTFSRKMPMRAVKEKLKSGQLK